MEEELLREAVGEESYSTLPPKGLPAPHIEELLVKWSGKDQAHWKSGQVSGAVYHGGDELVELAVSGAWRWLGWWGWRCVHPLRMLCGRGGRGRGSP